MAGTSSSLVVVLDAHHTLALPTTRRALPPLHYPLRPPDTTHISLIFLQTQHTVVPRWQVEEDVLLQPQEAARSFSEQPARATASPARAEPDTTAAEAAGKGGQL